MLSYLQPICLAVLTIFALVGISTCLSWLKVRKMSTTSGVPSATTGVNATRLSDISLLGKVHSVLYNHDHLRGTIQLSLTFHPQEHMVIQTHGLEYPCNVMLVRITDDYLKELDEKLRKNTEEQKYSSSPSSEMTPNEIYRAAFPSKTPTNEKSESTSDPEVTPMDRETMQWRDTNGF